MVTPGIPRIQRLDEAVVNRIAAGEIIQRPANALKEMIENSLDAKSTSVAVTVKDGGLKLLQIQDNGCGISVDDLNIVCERFTTSKLQKFEDLQEIRTYGFRGEALASISHVARVTITTRTADSPSAWRACYSDGLPVPPKPGQGTEPQQCAGNKGTQIAVEDLFFNVPSRRKALKSPGEEYSRILDVVQRYAIHNAGIAMTCKKHGSPAADLQTSTTMSTLDVLRQVYGAALARELLPVSFETPKLSYSLKGFVSNANYNTKKSVFLLFINHRSVESSNLKRAVDSLYAMLLPKGTHPFLYLSLEIEPRNVDVNVHPTKREVRFLHEDEVIQDVVENLKTCLAGANSSRSFVTQVVESSAPVRIISASGSGELRTSLSARPPAESIPQRPADLADAGEASNAASGILELAAPAPVVSIPKSKKPAPQGLVRTDPKSRTITSFMPGLSSAKRPAPSSDQMDIDRVLPAAPANARQGPVDAASEDENELQDSQGRPVAKRQRVEVRLTSVLQLRGEFADACDNDLKEILRAHTYVGCVDFNHALIQHSTYLYLVNYREIARALFYELSLHNFANFGVITLTPPAPIGQLVSLALHHVPTEPMTAQEVTELLISRAAMLEEYFMLKITPHGDLTTLPIILRGWAPNLDGLPGFLLHLATKVDWTSEQGCFNDVCTQLAALYSLPAVPSTAPFSVTQESDVSPEEEWRIENVLFPALRSSSVHPPARTATGADVLWRRVAGLGDLYKVFERC